MSADENRAGGDAAHRQRVRRIFLEVAELPEAQRSAALDAACGEEHAVRAEVERLLAADVAAGGFMGSPTASGVASVSTMGVPLTERAGTVIGPYKLLQKIGEGGFGAVFLAEQSVPVRRRVALKIIKLGMDTRQVIARFEAERQALALMDHPNIARVLDAGATETGRPYFVMEYVTGDSITAFAEAHKLSVRERLGLFTQVCHAVQHAHQKGIIHRDLKPGNVLVSMSDGRPFAKVIDFGIAKATGAASLTDKTLFTEHRQLIGTPEYMSPEQAEGSPDIDTRTDVYALGVVLYELLTGLTPFDGKRLRSAAWGEMQRIIREEEPPAPSLRLERTLKFVAEVHGRGEPGGDGDAARGEDAIPPSRVGLDGGGRVAPRELAGELDWIVLKALEKDRARRYESPNQLAADVSRHLAGEAVVAAPASVGYRVRKFVRRNRGVVGAVSAVMLSLLAGGSVAVWGWETAWRRQVELSEANETLRQSAELAKTSMEEAALMLNPDCGDAVADGFTDGTRIKLEMDGVKASEEQVGIKAMAGFLRRTAQQLLDANEQLSNELRRAELAEATLTLNNYLLGFADREVARVDIARVIAIREKYLGSDHLETLDAMWLMADQILQGQEQQSAFEVIERRIARRGYRLDSALAYHVAAKSVRAMSDLELDGERRWRAALSKGLVPLFEVEGAAGVAKVVRDLRNLGGVRLAIRLDDESIWTAERVQQASKQLASFGEGDVLLGAARAWTYDFPMDFAMPGARAEWEAYASPKWDAIERAASALVGTPGEASALSALAMVRRAKGDSASAIELADRAARARGAASTFDVLTRALALHASGDAEGAKRALEEATAMAARSPVDGLWDVNGSLAMARKAITPESAAERK